MLFFFLKRKMGLLDDLRKFNARTLLQQIINLTLVVSSALVIWKLLIVYTKCHSPIVVVLTGSMEPGFYRGDLLFLSNHFDRSDPIKIGDIVVYQLHGKDIPIVHRVLRLHESSNYKGKDLSAPAKFLTILTKGDNNSLDDRALYNKGKEWLDESHILGRVRGMLPYVGMVTVIMNDYPFVKYILIAVLAIMVLTSKNES